jgi:DNA-binding transcriptional ArsR family regulator
MQNALEIISEPEKAERLAEVLKALAHPLRLRLVATLCQDERNVQELCGLLDARQALVSQHLSVLRMVGLVAAERSGGTATYSIKEPGLRNLVKCLTGCQGR